MQETVLGRDTLEEFYTQVILPQFDIHHKQILWQKHEVIGPDSDMHVFFCDNQQMVLVFDNYPTTTTDTLSQHFKHRIISSVERGGGNVTTDNQSENIPDNRILRFGPSTPFTYVHNITGYFQLFRLDTTEADAHIMRLQARRRSISHDTQNYLSLVSLGYEIIALGRIPGVDLGHIVHMAQSARELAASYDFDDLEHFFWDIAGIGCFIGDGETSLEEQLLRAKKELKSLVDAAHINPHITAKEQALLDKHITPIHTKMMRQPEKSPEYFVDMAHELNRLITSEHLSECAAGHELSYTLDRPQIATSKTLQNAVALAYKLELPGTFRTHDSHRQWQDFYKEAKKC